MKKVIMLLTLSILASGPSYGQSNCASIFSGIQSKQHLIALAESKNPEQILFIKDAPVLAYRITSNRFEDIPSAIARHLGGADQTKYNSDYLAQNIGSVFALQMNGDKPDFYVIGKTTFEAKYTSVPTDRVVAKDGKYLGKLSQHIPELLNTNDKNLIAVLKMASVAMIRMSDLGYSIDAKVTIESPWGEQTKPSGADAFLVFDESKQQFYMVNADVNGLPLSYVLAK